MSSTPSWISESVASGQNYNDDTPSWLGDNVQGGSATGTGSATATGTGTGTGTTTASGAGDVQMVTVEKDGFGTPSGGTAEAPGTGTGTGTESNAKLASQKTWGEFWRSSFQRDGRTLLIAILIIICMNIPYVQWALYPFTIFSTWIHELCHGLAAEMVGGTIVKLEIFPDTSGLATISLSASSADKRGFIASAGYQGTAVIGMLLLLIRRTKRGPRVGTMAISFMMVLSVALWIRNAFGIAFILSMGVVLAIAGWKLPSWHMRNLYVVLAVTCALNAITSIQALFGKTHQVNGQDSSTDAHTMAEVTGGGTTMWAFIWLFLGVGLALIGLLFAIPGPDQAADFTLCGMCQDIGCFYICNVNGKRLLSTLFRRGEDTTNNDSNNGTTAEQSVV